MHQIRHPFYRLSRHAEEICKIMISNGDRSSLAGKSQSTLTHCCPKWSSGQKVYFMKSAQNGSFGFPRGAGYGKSAMPFQYTLTVSPETLQKKNPSSSPSRKAVIDEEKLFHIQSHGHSQGDFANDSPGTQQNFNRKKILEKLSAAQFEVDLRTVQRNLQTLLASKEFGVESDGQIKDGKFKKDSAEWWFTDDAPVTLFPSMDGHTAVAFRFG